jgi:hypothetical protein
MAASTSNKENKGNKRSASAARPTKKKNGDKAQTSALQGKRSSANKSKAARRKSPVASKAATTQDKVARAKAILLAGARSPGAESEASSASEAHSMASEVSSGSHDSPDAGELKKLLAVIKRVGATQAKPLNNHVSYALYGGMHWAACWKC